jgi:hypothetical protein
MREHGPGTAARDHSAWATALDGVAHRPAFGADGRFAGRTRCGWDFAPWFVTRPDDRRCPACARLEEEH